MTAKPTNQPSTVATTEQAFLSELDAKLWKSAETLRSNMDAANYKHVVLGLIFLKYISDSFTAQQDKIISDLGNPDSEFYYPQDDLSDDEYQAIIKDELEITDYYTKDNVFWVDKSARWDNIKKVVNLPKGTELEWGGKFGGVAQLIDSAFDSIERDNPRLKGVINRISPYQVDETKLIGLINLFSDTSFTRPTHDGQPVALLAKDILGHVYEYFLGQFALAEGKKGGQYFTPKSIVTLIIEMLEPYSGRIYDPAMGSGGFFVQTEKFIRQHQGNRNDISIYGQESNPTTHKLACMNMAIRGLEFNFGSKNADTFLHPQHKDLKADFIMANPPFNMKDWWYESLAGDPRWAYGTPPQGNANLAWLQHMIHHLSPKGNMALLLANGSMSSQTSGEGEIRKNIIQADLVEAMIALPNQLFTNTQIPACIWIINKAKARKGEVLFINTTQIGYMKDRVLRDFTPDDIAKIATTYHNWQKGQQEQEQGYENIPAFCYSATLDEIAKNDFVLTAGRYVGAAVEEDDGVPFAQKMQELTACLQKQFAQTNKNQSIIIENLKTLEYRQNSNIEFIEHNLVDLVNFSQGVQIPFQEQYLEKTDDKERFIRIVDYSYNNEPPRYVTQRKPKYWVNEDDVVMIRYGHIGRVVNGISGYIANNLFRIIPKDEKILNKEYLYYFLSKKEVYDYLVSCNSSSAMPSIKFSDFDKIKIPLPSLENQIKIIQKLKVLDDKIKENNKINQTLSNIRDELLPKLLSGEIEL